MTTKAPKDWDDIIADRLKRANREITERPSETSVHWVVPGSSLSYAPDTACGLEGVPFGQASRHPDKVTCPECQKFMPTIDRSGLSPELYRELRENWKRELRRMIEAKLGQTLPPTDNEPNPIPKEYR